VELGLTAVVATQLWHHLFIGPELAELSTSTGNRMTFASTAL
jgi:hypothetical protein